MVALCILCIARGTRTVEKGTSEIETFVRSYPKEFYGYLIESTTFDITPNYILDSFMIRYSDEGSNDRTLKEAIDHLHASKNILIEQLIAVTSRLDVLVAHKNVLQPMGIQ